MMLYNFTLVHTGSLTLLCHQDKKSVKNIPPQTPILCSKFGAYRGIPIFHIFDPKHKLWVFTKGALMCNTINVLSKNKKNIIFFHRKLSIFASLKHLYILHGHIFIMIFLKH